MEVLLENGPKMMMHFCAALRVSYIYISSHLCTFSFNTNSLLLFFFFFSGTNEHFTEESKHFPEGAGGCTQLRSRGSMHGN